MKDKILTFIIGALVGAIIATAGFYIYAKNNSSDNEMMGQDAQIEQQDAPEMPDGDNGSAPEDAPEKPDGDNGSAPEKPSEN